MAIYNKLLLLNIADLILSEVWIDNYKQTKKKWYKLLCYGGEFKTLKGVDEMWNPCLFAQKFDILRRTFCEPNPLNHFHNLISFLCNNKI